MASHTLLYPKVQTYKHTTTVGIGRGLTSLRAAHLVLVDGLPGLLWALWACKGVELNILHNLWGMGHGAEQGSSRDTAMRREVKPAVQHNTREPSTHCLPYWVPAVL